MARIQTIRFNNIFTMKKEDKETVTREFPRLLSRRQVAKFMGLHPGSIKRYEKAGILPAYKINSRLTRYDERDVLRFIEEGRVET